MQQSLHCSRPFAVIRLDLHQLARERQIFDWNFGCRTHRFTDGNKLAWNQHAMFPQVFQLCSHSGAVIHGLLSSHQFPNLFVLRAVAVAFGQSLLAGHFRLNTLKLFRGFNRDETVDCPQMTGEHVPAILF